MCAPASLWRTHYLDAMANLFGNLASHYELLKRLFLLSGFGLLLPEELRNFTYSLENKSVLFEATVVLMHGFQLN